MNQGFTVLRNQLLSVKAVKFALVNADFLSETLFDPDERPLEHQKVLELLTWSIIIPFGIHETQIVAINKKLVH